MATVTTSRRKNTLKEITRKIPSQFKIFENNVIFFQHNSYSIGQFIGASRQYCHIHSLPTDSPLRILWHSVYVITANVQSIETLPNVAISGFLALDPDALCYKRTHKIDGDIVTFNRTELPRKLSPITVYKSKEYPSIVAMIPAINCQFYAEIIQKIPSKHVIKYVNTITSNGDASDLDSDLDIESINECKSESPSRGTKRPLSELIVYKSGNPPKKQKQSLIYSFTTNTANDSNTNRKPMTLITPKKHSQNSSKSNTKSMKKSAKKSLSQTEIAQNATEKYKFTDDIIIYDLNGKRYVHLNDKYTDLKQVLLHEVNSKSIWPLPILTLLRNDSIIWGITSVYAFLIPVICSDFWRIILCWAQLRK